MMSSLFVLSGLKSQLRESGDAARRAMMKAALMKPEACGGCAVRKTRDNG
jgi:hypothetical protein